MRALVLSVVASNILAADRSTSIFVESNPTSEDGARSTGD